MQCRGLPRHQHDKGGHRELDAQARALLDGVRKLARRPEEVAVLLREGAGGSWP